jgi:membrane associated rhomboid family serine protease
MAGPMNELMEIILRDCAAAGDQPWYPAEYAQFTGVERARIDACLDELRLGGLVRLTEWVRGKGQGYTLTEEGHEVLRNPRQLNQVRQHGVTARPARARTRSADEADLAPRDWDRGKALADVLMTPRPPTITMILIGLNVVNFAIGLMLVSQSGGSVNEYLVWSSADPKVNQARHVTGALHGRDLLLQGEWWRLLTCCFVHIGAIHLLMNMWVLYSIGPMLEQVWGRVRFTVLYLVSGLGGSLAAVYFNPEGGLAGASGAICGLIGSLLAFVWLNKNYISRAGDWLRNIMTNVVLIVLISLIPGVSASGHAGGGIAGLVLTVPLNFSRFGTGQQRWAGLAGVIVLVIALIGIIGAVANSDLTPDQVKYQYYKKIHYATALALNTDRDFRNWANRMKDGKKVPEAETEKLQADIEKARAAIEEILTELKQSRQYKDASVNTALEQAETYFEKWEDYYQLVQEIFDKKGQFTQQQRQELESKMSRLNELWQDVNNSVLGPFEIKFR